MKIERLIQIFEQLLPIYEKGYREKYCRIKMKGYSINKGMCFCAHQNKITAYFYELSDEFSRGYYSKLSYIDNYLFPRPYTWQDLKPRIDFMKSEIKSLKKLLKQGYTHV